MSDAAFALQNELADLGLAHEAEVRFHPVRRWRFDLAWPSAMVAVEVDGRGRHQTVDGTRKDYEKLNEAARLGWTVLRFPATDYKPSRTRKQWPGGAADWAEFIRQVLETRR